jgi:SPX domain protein involved in polyphosphate accumulation
VHSFLDVFNLIYSFFPISRDNEEANELENETKIKSLQLRIKGQLQTIHTLEEKLSTTVTELEDHKRLLATAQSKLLNIDRKEKLKYRGKLLLYFRYKVRITNSLLS